jgi:ubiquitin C-terminal hydrolase
LNTEVNFPVTGFDLTKYLTPDIRTSLSTPNSTCNSPYILAPKTLPSTIIEGIIKNDINQDTRLLPTLEIPQQKPIYDLFSVSHHEGTIDRGHYIAHVNTAHDLTDTLTSRWICFDDDQVSMADTSSSAFGESAYLLFYRLREN